jgi:hypothetical protein
MSVDELAEDVDYTSPVARVVQEAVEDVGAQEVLPKLVLEGWNPYPSIYVSACI